jgi:hypothetical protein
MRFVPTRIHGLIDYLMGLALIALPWFCGLGRGTQTWLPVVLGAAVLTYSFLTDYELGAAPLFSMPFHLVMDGLGGALLAASPWLFGFADLVWVPHLILGLVALGVACVTQTVPNFGSRPAANDPFGTHPMV